MEKNNWKGWLYLLPAIAFLAVFMVYPLIDVLIYSLEEGYNFASQTYFGVGAYNYAYVLHDPYFLQALKNTFILVIITVPVSTGLALLISVGLSSIRKLRELYQTIYFLPYVTNTLAVGLVFMILFKKTPYTDGLANLILSWFGVAPIDFIDGPYWAKMFVLCFYTVWVVMPFKILILTSALASVDETYYNAAKIDGTSKWRTFTRITPHDLPHGVLSHHHRLHRRVQGLFRRSGSLRHRPERRRHEHHRGLHLRYALRHRRRLSLLRLRRSHHPVHHRADHHLHQPAGEQKARPLLRRRQYGLRKN